MSSNTITSQLQRGLSIAAFAIVTAALSAGCSQSDGNDVNKTAIESEAEARTIVTDSVKLMFPGIATIPPQNATLTPCGNYDKNAIGEGPPWSAEASQSLAGPDQVSEAIRRLETLAESGYRLRPRGQLRTFPEEKVYEDERGVTIGISATKLPDRVYFSVFSSTPCTIDKP